MSSSAANVATENASRYLQQLCKHWSHRFSVTFDPHRGTVDFGEGQTVELTASDTALAIDLRGPGEAELPGLEKVLEDHLKRFAFRESLEFAWKRA